MSQPSMNSNNDFVKVYKTKKPKSKAKKNKVKNSGKY